MRLGSAPSLPWPHSVSPKELARVTVQLSSTLAGGSRPPGREPAQGGREGAGGPHPTHGHPLRAGAPSCLCSLVQSALPRGTFSFNVVEADLLSAAR